ncbi:MAG: preprotein translocase subunit SecG [Acidobacteriota bacterium]
MIILFTILHVLVCFFLIIVVLLQSGKAADLAGAFGGMGSQTAFGPRGAATILSKATTISAALFMLTSLSLAILYTREGHVTGSVLDKAPASQSAPAKSSTATPAIPGQQPSPAPAPAPSPARK